MKCMLGWLVILFTTLHAQTIVIDEDFEYIKASPFMKFVADVNHSFTIENVHEAQWRPMLSSNLGGCNPYPSWTHVSLKNPTNERKRLLIKNPRAGMDEIDLYLVRNSGITHILLGDMHTVNNRTVPHRYSVEVIELLPNEEIDIIAKLSNTIGSTEGEWEIFTRKYFIDFTMNESLWWGVFIGIYIALFFYSIPILIASKNSLLSFYFSGYIISSIAYQLTLNGIFYTWGIYGSILNLITMIFGNAFFLFTMLVIFEFFKVTHHNGFLLRLLRLMVAIFFVNLLLCLTFYLFDPSLLRILAIISSYLGIFILPLWIVLLSKLFAYSHDKAYRFIFLGFTAIFLAFVYQLLISLGIFQMYHFSIYTVSLASMLEMYFFALSISLYIKQMQDKALANQQLLDFQMRFASIGRVIGNITHQWKMPMIHACSLLTHMEALIHFKNKKVVAEIEQLIPQIRSHFIFMQNTIDEFYSLYNKDTKKTDFYLMSVINDVWGMLSSKISACEMKLHVKDLQNTQLFSYEYSFAHIMIILIDNALDAMKTRNRVNPQMLIEISHDNDIICISIEDNCGGIEQKPIESIFDLETTSKHATENSGGLGLSIVKLLITEKFGGNIHVANTNEGARFTLFIPKVQPCF